MIAVKIVGIAPVFSNKIKQTLAALPAPLSA